MVTELLSIDFRGEDSALEFLAGPENRAAVSVAECFGRAERARHGAPPSPLVLVGPNMSGKTLLALGLAQRWRTQRPVDKGPVDKGLDDKGLGDKVLQMTAADYAREFAHACQADTVDAFTKRVRGCGLLVLDAVDELAGKAAAQEHLCRTLDTLATRGAACVTTLRRPAGQQREFSPGLISRLAGGLCVPVALPSESTRCEAALLFARRRDLPLDEEGARWLARRLPEGIAPIAAAVAELSLRHPQPIDQNALQQLLRRRDEPPKPTLSAVASATARQFAAKVGDLTGPSRRSGLVRARSMAMLAARRLTGESLSRIGRHFGGRDHTTVMHACRKMQQRIASDNALANAWEELLTRLGEHRDSPAQTPAVDNLSAQRPSRS